MSQSFLSVYISRKYFLTFLYSLFLLVWLGFFSLFSFYSYGLLFGDLKSGIDNLYLLAIFCM